MASDSGKCDKCGKVKVELYSKWMTEFSKHVYQYCRPCYKKVHKHDFYTDRVNEILDKANESRKTIKEHKVKAVRRK